MTTKHKNTPATPLPWHIDGKYIRHDRERDPRGPAIADCDLSHGIGEVGEKDARNAAYIVHAANAYPQLIEKARAVLTAWQSVPEDMQVPDEINGGQIEELAALLHELGEDA